jgi:hypothetical protein
MHRKPPPGTAAQVPPLAHGLLRQTFEFGEVDVPYNNIKYFIKY